MEFFVYPSQKKKFCSKKCMGLAQAKEHNPNYGNRWSNEQKVRQSELVKSRVTPEYRTLAGSANRGKKFSKELIQKMHSGRSSESYSRPHTDETKKLIGLKSKQKFTDEYKKRQKNQFVELNIWVSDSLKADIEIYRQHAHWKHGMWNIVSEGVDKIQTHGIFSARSNIRGCVRDHRLSKTDGFLLGVYPEILRHPANCEILTHAENASKGRRSSITLEELFYAIKTFQGQWPEQALVLSLIQQYQDGHRVNVADYRGR